MADEMREWLENTAAVMNPEPDLSGKEPRAPRDDYDEQTLVMFDGTEVLGKDGYGWYVEADDAEKVVRRLNYEDDYDDGVPRRIDRGGRHLAKAVPGRNPLYMHLRNVRMSDFLQVGFDLVEDPEASPSP